MATDIDALNHSISVRRSAKPDPLPSYDPRKRREPHESHVWDADGTECEQCGTRPHWPSVEKKCRLTRSAVPRVSGDEFREGLAWSLDRFLEWWDEKDHPVELPSTAEWLANLIEWTREYPIPTGGHTE